MIMTLNTWRNYQRNRLLGTNCKNENNLPIIRKSLTGPKPCCTKPLFNVYCQLRYLRLVMIRTNLLKLDVITNWYGGSVMQTSASLVSYLLKQKPEDLTRGSLVKFPVYLKGCVRYIFANLFVSLGESTCEARKSFFTSKTLLVLEISNSKFSEIQII